MGDSLPSRRSPAATKAAGEKEWSGKGENVDDSVMAIDLDVNFEAEVWKLRGQWELASVLNFLNVSFVFSFTSSICLIEISSFVGRERKCVRYCIGDGMNMFIDLFVFLAVEVFEPVIGKSLRISAEEIEKGLIEPESSLAELHIALLKVDDFFFGLFLHIFKCTAHQNFIT